MLQTATCMSLAAFGTVESVEESGSFFAQLAMGSARLTPLEQVALRPSAPGQ